MSGHLRCAVAGPSPGSTAGRAATMRCGAIPLGAAARTEGAARHPAPGLPHHVRALPLRGLCLAPSPRRRPLLLAGPASVDLYPAGRDALAGVHPLVALALTTHSLTPLDTALARGMCRKRAEKRICVRKRREVDTKSDSRGTAEKGRNRWIHAA